MPVDKVTFFFTGKIGFCPGCMPTASTPVQNPIKVAARQFARARVKSHTHALYSTVTLLDLVTCFLRNVEEQKSRGFFAHLLSLPHFSATTSQKRKHPAIWLGVKYIRRRSKTSFFNLPQFIMSRHVYSDEAAEAAAFAFSA